MNFQKITVEAYIQKDIKTVWDLYNTPEHVRNWNHASDDWHSPFAENNLEVDGRFKYRMEAKDGSFGFDFEGTYTRVEKPYKFSYIMDDQRAVDVSFQTKDNGTQVIVVFDAETENTLELQKEGWQEILNNFKQYAESLG